MDYFDNLIYFSSVSDLAMKASMHMVNQKIKTIT